MEGVGASGDQPDLVVERFSSSVGDAQASGGEDAVAVAADRLGQADERWHAAAAGLGAETPEQLIDIIGGETGREDRAQRFLELIGAGNLATGGLQRSQRRDLSVREVLRSFERRPAGVLEALGGVSIADQAQLVPVLAAHLVQRVAAELGDVEAVDAHDGLGCVGAGALGIAGAHVHRDRGDLGGTFGAQLRVEVVGDGGAGAFGAPDDLAATVIGDEGQVAMALAPGDLVDADLDEAVEATGVQFVGADARHDPPDGAPVDAQHPGDRRLVCPGRKPRHQMLEVVGEVRAVAREGHCLGADAVLRADQPAQPRSNLHAPDPEVEMAPVAVDRTDVVTVRRAERAQRADQPPTTQRDLDDHAIGLEANGADPHPLQAQQQRECGADAHGTIDLQFAGFDTRDPRADPVRV